MIAAPFPPWASIPLLFTLAVAGSAAQTRRALVVGIDQYHARGISPSALVKRLPVRGTSTRTKWTDLDGAVNDARQMKALLIGRFGFKEQDVVFLSNERATADAILSTLKSHLIDRAARGDISLFYFAGHGSQIANKLTDEADGLDETIVPADAPLGTPDIRDKELARLYRAAVRQGVVLTVIQDTCHSGSAARGSWNARGKVRELPRDGRYVEDPPDRDGSGKALKAPEEEGVLVLSASQDYEPASEVATDSGAHGLFSFALFHALETSPPNERVDRTFQRVRAIMQSEGALQEPVMAGAGRAGRGLLGSSAGSEDGVTAAVARIDSGKVQLQAGTANGLYEGCELKRAGNPDEPAVRIRIVQVTGLNSSAASVLEGDVAGIHEGDLFLLDRWVTPEFAGLRVFIPPALPAAEIQAAVRTAREAATMVGVKWVEDPTLESPQAVMSRQGTSWFLELNPAVNSPLDLGSTPSAPRLAQALRSLRPASFFLLLPPPSELRLPFGRGTAYGSIIPESSAARAHYVLYGRASASGLAWSWVLPNLTERDVQKSDPPLAMPLRTDWFPSDLASKKLTESAAAIARVRAWLQLPSPPADLQFPYRLALREASSGKTVRSGEIGEGQQFKLWLEAPSPPRGEVPRRWIYIFEIDREGKGTLIFPAKGQGNVSNKMPVTAPGAETAPAGFPLTPDTYDIEVSAPFGVDTFFLLVSEDALPNPEVLDFAGVYKAQRGATSDSPLAALLSRVGDGTRGQQAAVPLNWFLERQAFRSVPRPK